MACTFCKVRTEAEETTEDRNFSPYDTGKTNTTFFPLGDKNGIQYKSTFSWEKYEEQYISLFG